MYEEETTNSNNKSTRLSSPNKNKTVPKLQELPKK